MYGLGCRARCAAEIKPIEPVWVMPAKGAEMAGPSAQAFLRVNGQIEPLNSSTLSAILSEKEITETTRGVAVAINGTVIPRAQWPSMRISAGDEIEIVRVRQGG